MTDVEFLQAMDDRTRAGATVFMKSSEYSRLCRLAGDDYTLQSYGPVKAQTKDVYQSRPTEVRAHIELAKIILNRAVVERLKQ